MTRILHDDSDTVLDGARADGDSPDLAGRTHRLADFRGRWVFLVAWASW